MLLFNAINDPIPVVRLSIASSERTKRPLVCARPAVMVVMYNPATVDLQLTKSIFFFNFFF